MRVFLCLFNTKCWLGVTQTRVLGQKTLFSITQARVLP